MSEDENLENAEATATETADSEATTEKPRRKGGRFAGFLAFLALLVAAGGIGAGYYAWLEIQKRFNSLGEDVALQQRSMSQLDKNPSFTSLQQRLTGSTESLGEEIETLRAQTDTLNKSLQEQQNQQAALNDAVTQSHNLITRSQRDWTIAEIEHLMNMASHRLRIAGDTKGAIAALQATDARLHDLSDPRLLPVREQLVDELYALKNFKHPDWTGVSLTLDRLITGLKPLPLKSQQQAAAEEPATPPESSDAEVSRSAWQKIKSSLKENLKKNVSIKSKQQAVALFSEQEEQLRGHQFLLQKLTSARLALISQDDDAFHRQLAEAVDWIQSNNNPQASKSLLDELQKLDQINLKPELPDISGSLTKLQSIERLRASAEDN